MPVNPRAVANENTGGRAAQAQVGAQLRGSDACRPRCRTAIEPREFTGAVLEVTRWPVLSMYTSVADEEASRFHRRLDVRGGLRGNLANADRIGFPRHVIG